MKKRNLIIVVVIVAVLVTCGAGACVLTLAVLNSPAISSGLEQLGSDFSAMIDLQRQVGSVYPAEEIQVKIQNGRILIVSLINAETDSGTHESRRADAEEVARFVWENYTEIDRIDAIQIVYVQHQRFVVVNLNQSYSYHFDTESFR